MKPTTPIAASLSTDGLERMEFEHWYSDGGKWTKGLERSGDSYKYMPAAEAWRVWQAAIKNEREACAKVCEAQITGGDYHYLAARGYWDHMAQAATNCAEAIRMRSNNI